MTICYAEEVDPLLSAKIRLKSIAILVYFMRIARLLAAGSCKCKFSNGVYSLVVDYFLSRAAVRNFDFFNCFNVLLNFLIFLLLQHICDQLLMLLKFMWLFKYRFFLQGIPLIILIHKKLILLYHFSQVNLSQTLTNWCSFWLSCNLLFNFLYLNHTIFYPLLPFKIP